MGRDDRVTRTPTNLSRLSSLAFERTNARLNGNATVARKIVDTAEPQETDLAPKGPFLSDDSKADSIAVDLVAVSRFTVDIGKK